MLASYAKEDEYMKKRSSDPEMRPIMDYCPLPQCVKRHEIAAHNIYVKATEDWKMSPYEIAGRRYADGLITHLAFLPQDTITVDMMGRAVAHSSSFEAYVLQQPPPPPEEPKNVDSAMDIEVIESSAAGTSSKTTVGPDVEMLSAEELAEKAQKEKEERELKAAKQKKLRNILLHDTLPKSQKSRKRLSLRKWKRRNQVLLNHHLISD